MSEGNDSTAVLRLNRYLSRHFRGRVPDSSTQLTELYGDSLELIEALFELEQHTGKTLTNAELASLSTLGDLIGFFAQSTPTERE